ncbi:MAG: gamma-glutamylcyclotransferase, partial [Reinekea forsetii]|nr:gamma-glutamylcyclotransferase [Reinekea forsetii]MDO7643914.1 gamma-glutamylcyclotransferase [Reinekea forsetii]
MNYIFGYGSLICSDSRSRTGVSGPAHPVEVQGIARKWSVHVPDYAATAVGAHSDAHAHCNGVFFAVDEDNL